MLLLRLRWRLKVRPGRGLRSGVGPRLDLRLRLGKRLRPGMRLLLGGDNGHHGNLLGA